MVRNNRLMVTEMILLDLQKQRTIPLKTIFEKIGHREYFYLRELKGLGLVEIKEGREGTVTLLDIEDDGGKINMLSYLKILKELGLTNTDMKVLRAKGERPEEIAQEKGLSVNIVMQRMTNIITRLEVGDLQKARNKVKKVFNKTKVPV